jgi:hypothetical protein
MEQVQIEMATTIPVVAVDRLYGELNSIIGKGTITMATVATIAFSLVQIVENYSSVSGVQKKALVLRTLDRFIKERIPDQKQAAEVSMIVRVTLPSLIDTFVSIDSGEVKIKTKKCFKNMFACCS